ncbi:MAG: radical SAM/Cys-rich domain protein [Desulfobacteraceae bacterium]|nr:radical SAM/Cys-rich domain protein [Desulfobacteraceae bacterium]
MSKLKEAGLSGIRTGNIEILQLNITRKCNLNCRHCHVQSGEQIEAQMSRQILRKCLDLASADAVHTIDITGGAPELHPDIGWFLSELRPLGKRVIVRTNLVILENPAYRQFFDIYETYRTELVASLPNYDKTKYERQRGAGHFDLCIAALRELNRRGYGKESTGLVLNLVCNPVGAILPASQRVIESEFRKNLKEKSDLVFNSLFCITNMPIGRYLDYLLDTDNFEEYINDLIRAFNLKTLENIMCRHTLSVAYNGSFYNCDFNQMLEMPLSVNGRSHIMQLSSEELHDFDILMNNHCYGCTAGSGSSCQGATV